jgi:hypothetical protein
MDGRVSLDPFQPYRKWEMSADLSEAYRTTTPNNSRKYDRGSVVICRQTFLNTTFVGTLPENAF